MVDVCCKYGILDVIFYKYKVKYGGMDVFDVCKFKVFEDENVKLKKFLVEVMLDNVILKDVVLKKW